MTSCDENSCFKGVECLETDIGMTCGSCPRGYIGDGTRNGCKRMSLVFSSTCFYVHHALGGHIFSI